MQVHIKGFIKNFLPNHSRKNQSVFKEVVQVVPDILSATFN